MTNIRLRLLCCATIIALLASGCAEMLRAATPTPTLLKPGANPHAFQSYAFIYNFANGNTRLWLSTLDVIEHDALPFLEALKKGGHGMKLSIKPQLGSQGIEFYHVDLTVIPKDGGTPVTLPGAPGTDPQLHANASLEAGRVLGISDDLVQRGHFALYGLVQVMTSLNAETETLRQHAFALMVLKEKVEAGEKADWFDGNRPPEETVADVNIALALIAHDQDRVVAEKTAIMGIVAMARHYQTDGVLETLRQELVIQRNRAQRWVESHKPPVTRDFGVEANVLNPDRVLQQLDDRFGFLVAVAQVAQGAASGDVASTLDGLGKLVPKDSSLGVVVKGLASAARGDIVSTIDAAAELGGYADEVRALKDRLSTVADLVGDAKQGLDTVRSAPERLRELPPQ